MEPSAFRFAIGIIFLACSCSAGPPIRTASGEIIEGVSYEERSPQSPDVHEVTFRGDRLREAVALMDRSGVMGISGSYQPANVVDKSTLVLTIRGADHRERKVLMTDCAEPHVCAFFAAAVKSDVVEKAPAVCRDGVLCMAP